MSRRTLTSWTERGQEIAHEWVTDVVALDAAVYSAVARTPTPALDRGLGRISSAANHSRLWFATAATLAVVGGRPGRAAAAQGVASIAVTSAVVNLVLKRAGGRQRPDRAGAEVPQARHVEMPGSLSFPSGHAAAAFAFATGVGGRLPLVAAPLHGAAGVVAYSRVHTGVHHPIDVVVGSIVGTLTAQLTAPLTAHLASRLRAQVGGGFLSR